MFWINNRERFRFLLADVVANRMSNRSFECGTDSLSTPFRTFTTFSNISIYDFKLPDLRYSSEIYYFPLPLYPAKFNVLSKSHL